jgi:uncharacterized protein (TIGR00369 family)
MKHMNERENYRYVPNKSWEKNCFGCSPANPAGLQMKFYTDETSIFSWFKVPEHLCGWNNLVHGGIISTILDEVMGWAAIHLQKLIVLTKTVTIDFTQPIFLGDKLKAESRITRFDNDGEVVVEATIHNERGELCAKSTGTYSYFSPEKISEMGIMDDDCLKEFEEYIAE